MTPASPATAATEGGDGRTTLEWAVLGEPLQSALAEVRQSAPTTASAVGEEALAATWRRAWHPLDVGQPRAVLNQSSERPSSANAGRRVLTEYVLLSSHIHRLSTLSENPESIPGVQADSSVARP